MNYFFNPAAFSGAFSLPSKIVDEYINLATQEELKVILYFYRYISDGFDTIKCANNLKISENNVKDALLFWAKNGILLSDEDKEPATDTVSPKSVAKNVKPSRTDVAKRGLEDQNVAFILREAQLKFGRNLKTNESSTLLYIYDDLGLDVSVVLFLLQYAVNEEKLNIRFIEKTAVDWVNNCVKTVGDAEKIISAKIKCDLAWKRTENAFGIEHRKPSAKETKYSDIWFNEWMLEDEILKIAYEVCVDNKSKFIFEYCAKVIENWHKQGLVSPADIRKSLQKEAKKPQKDRKYSYAGYDIELYEQMLNSDD
ncbi:MAG: DnaD domain protein [Clostridia bacterium]|nr:DnaD domain protein [Clostridia bacterium]